LTLKEVEELNAFFETIYEKLNSTESDEETSQIFNEAIKELGRYDLLGGLSVEQMKRRFLQYNNMDIESNYLPAKTNSNCLIMGRTTCTFIYSPLFGIIESIIEQSGDILFSFLIFLVLFKQFTMTFGFPFFPLRIGSYITMGFEFRNWPDYSYNSAEGWIISIGTNGIKSWIGEFAGTLGSFPGWWSSYFIGVEGFFGLRLYNPQNDKNTLIGYARNVGIEYD